MAAAATSSVQIHIRPAAGVWSVRVGGVLVAESERALELIEGSRPPVVYFPREDVTMALLERAQHETLCPHKGMATYFDIVAPAGRVPLAVWSYEAPKQPLGAIAGWLAFYTDKVTLSQH